MKKLLLILLLAISASFAKAQTAKIDSSTLFNELLSLTKLSPEQADNYLTNKGFSVFSKASKDVGLYTTEITKYKIPGRKDNYGIGTVKNLIVQALYITYSDEVNQKILNDALKAGFKENKAANKPNATAYDKGSVRFLVLKIVVGDEKFYAITLADLSIVQKAANDWKKN